MQSTTKQLKAEDYTIDFPCSGNCSNCKIMEFLQNSGLPRTYIGSDPEFAMQGRAGGEYTFEDVTYDYEVDVDRVGYDGDGTTGEMRPYHNECPIKHGFNIIELIRYIEEDLEEEAGGIQPYWVMGGPICDPQNSRVYALGGHIHFSDVYDTTLYNRAEFYNALVNFLVLPFAAYADLDLVQERIDKTGYGRMYETSDIGGDEMRRSDGQHDGWEFRLLPSFLIDDQAVMEVLAVAKTVITEVLMNPDRFRKALMKKIVKDYNNGIFSEEMAARILMSYSEIKQFALYPLFKELIDNFYEAVISGVHWNYKAFSFADREDYSKDQNVIDKFKTVQKDIDKYLKEKFFFEVVTSSDINIGKAKEAILSSDRLAELFEFFNINKVVVYGLHEDRGEHFFIQSKAVDWIMDTSTELFYTTAGYQFVIRSVFGSMDSNTLSIGIPKTLRLQFGFESEVVSFLEDVISCDFDNIKEQNEDYLRICLNCKEALKTNWKECRAECDNCGKYYQI